MREIKFRGKSIINGKWVYGFYVHYMTPQEGEVHSIIDSDGRWIKINPITLGQYIRRNIKGEELYEGDILGAHDDSMIIVYTEGSYIARSISSQWKKYFYKAYLNYNLIGNRFDNDELLNDTKHFKSGKSKTPRNENV